MILNRTPMLLRNVTDMGGEHVLFKIGAGYIVLRETGYILTEKRFTNTLPAANGEAAFIENVGKEPIGSDYEGKLIFEISAK